MSTLQYLLQKIDNYRYYRSQGTVLNLLHQNLLTTWYRTEFRKNYLLFLSKLEFIAEQTWIHSFIHSHVKGPKYNTVHLSNMTFHRSLITELHNLEDTLGRSYILRVRLLQSVRFHANVKQIHNIDRCTLDKHQCIDLLLKYQ